VKRPKSVGTADRAIWIAHECLKTKVIFSTAKSAVGEGKPLVITGGTTPAEVAKWSGMTKLEAELALKLVVQMGHARRRRDGRFFYAEPPKEQVAEEGHIS